MSPAVRRLSIAAMLALSGVQTACPGWFWRHERRDERQDNRQDNREERRN